MLKSYIFTGWLSHTRDGNKLSPNGGDAVNGLLTYVCKNFQLVLIIGILLIFGIEKNSVAETYITNDIAEGDALWYELTVVTTGVVGINAWTDGSTENDDISIYLYDSAGKKVAEGNGYYNKVSITYFATSTGTFKVKIYLSDAYNGGTRNITTTSNFLLSVFTTTVTPTPSPTPSPTPIVVVTPTQSPSPSPTPVFYDDFNDNTINTLVWHDYTTGTGPTVNETNQRLEIKLPANSEDSTENIFGAGYGSNCSLKGDFDIQVDYELLTWPGSNGVRVGLGIFADNGGGVVERVSFGSSSDFYGYPREVYLVDFNDEVQGITSTNDTSGKLRLVRKNSTLTGYYYSSGTWNTIHSSLITTSDVTFGLSAWSHNNIFADQEVKIAFDNFTINSGEIIYTETTPTPQPSPTPNVSPSPTPAGKGILFGFVYNEDIEPLKDVTVNIKGTSLSKSTKTDEEGYYEFTDLEAGEYTLTYKKNGYGMQSQEVSLEEEETLEVETVIMEEVVKGMIYGYVLNIYGDPLESVRLKLKGIRTEVKKNAVSDADGYFEFKDLEADTYLIFATKRFYKKAKQTVKLEEGEDKEIEIEMGKTRKKRLLPEDETIGQK